LLPKTPKPLSAKFAYALKKSNRNIVNHFNALNHPISLFHIIFTPLRKD